MSRRAESGFTEYVRGEDKQLDRLIDRHERSQREEKQRIREAKYQRSENISNTKTAFVGFVYIVLFIFFTTTFATLPRPQNVNDIESSQAYMVEIAPQITATTTGAIQAYVNILNPIVKSIQFLVTSFGEVVSAGLRFIGWAYAPLFELPEDPTTICEPYEEVTFIQNINYTSNR